MTANTKTDEPLRADLQAQLDEWSDAIAANDATRIGAFAEPEWVLLGPGAGPTERHQFLSLVESGDLTHSAMRNEVLDARRYGDTAVVRTHNVNQGTWQGQPFESDEWTLNVFVRRPDGWRCVVTALMPRSR